MNESEFMRPVTGRGMMRLLTLWMRIARTRPGAIALITSVNFGLGITEGAGLGLLLPLLFLVGVHSDANPSAAAEGISAALQAVGIPIELVWILTTFLVIALTELALQFYHQYLLVHFRESLQQRLRRTLFSLYSQATWSHQAHTRSAQIANGIITEVPRIGAAAAHVVHAIGISTMFLFYAAISAWISWKFTCLIVLAGGASFIALRRLIRRTHRAGESTYSAANRFQEVIKEQLASTKMIHSINAWDRSREMVEHSIESLKRFQVHINIHTALVSLIVQPFALILLAIIVYLGVEAFRMPAADLMVMLVIFYRLAPRLVKLQEILQRTAALLPSYAHVAAICDELQVNREPSGRRAFAGVRQAIELVGVNVRLEEVLVLDHVDLSIPCNRTVAILGPSGSGKSTILDLLAGLRRPDGGAVTIDGVPLGEFDINSLRDRISVVQQHPAFFNASIRENILFVAPHAQEPDIWQTLESVGAAEFVRSRPAGLDTLIGDQGVRLSGGQLQRIDLARALLRKPDILLLDEPTSALDVETRRDIAGLLESLKGAMIIVVVTHDEQFASIGDITYRFSAGKLRKTADRTVTAAE